MNVNYIQIGSASADLAETLPILFKLDQNYFPTPWTEKDWDDVFYEGSSRFILGQKHEKALVGFSLFDINIVDSFAHLLKIVVKTEIRGLGFGKKLLIESLNILKERGIKTFFLEVEEFNTPAVKLYESLGFKMVHKKKHFYSNGATALIMTLKV